MPDNPVGEPLLDDASDNAPQRGFRATRAPRERGELPEALLRRIKQYSGRLSTEAVYVMQERLPFFTDLEASQRSSVALVVQTAVNNFVEWIRDPEGTVGFTMQAFEVVPQDLARRIALRQSVEMVRVAMEFFEEVLPLLARNDEQLVTLTEGILRYSRDLAFGAASAYAEAAEARGAWDSRLEATVVDAVVRGDTGPDMLSRAAALNWNTTEPATVVVGTPQPESVATATTLVHEVAQRHGRRALAVIQGTRLLVIVSGPIASHNKFVTELLGVFSDGPVVVGPTTPTLSASHTSAVEALSGMDAVSGWRGAPRPVAARELLPERALMGDRAAIAALNSEVMRPLADAGPALTETLDTYLDSGGAIEACARALFVHPNTVRYRLKRITDFTGRDPTSPRDAYVLRVAATIARLSRDHADSFTSEPGVTPVTINVIKA